MLSKEEIVRYSRHIKMKDVGMEGQEKLKGSRVLVIGAGGLGCPVLQYLCAAGVGTIGVLDDDTVDASNLQRQVLYNQNDIGLSKVDCAIAHLSAQNRFVNFIAHPVRLTTENALSIMRDYDIVLDGSDNFPTRYLVNDACIVEHKPLVFGSIYQFEGQLSVFNYRGGPSYRCIYPTPPVAGAVPNCSEIGVFGVLPGVIGTKMAVECLKMILGIGTVLSGKLLIHDVLQNKELLVNIHRNDAHFQRTALESDYEAFCNLTTPEHVAEISVQELHNRLSSDSSLLLIDVREEYEHEICLIEGSVKLPLGQLAVRYSEIDPSIPTVMICHHGMRSESAITFLKEKGYERLINLRGGINAWALEVDSTMETY